MIAFLLTVALHTETWAVGQTVNQDWSLIYWVVEWTGQDYSGNVHRMREEVTTGAGVGRAYVEWKALNRLSSRVREGDEQVIGFLEAVESGQ